MRRRDWNQRAARIASGKCPRCGRLAVGWPIRRPDVCAPGGDATVCWRTMPDILRAEARLEVR